MSNRSDTNNVEHLFDNNPRKRCRAAIRTQVKHCLGRLADAVIPPVRRTVAEFLSDYELRCVTEQEEVTGFAYLERTGLINQLPGRYGRIAKEIALAEQLSSYGTIQ